MADQWYRYAQGFLLVYSITDRQSYFNIRKLHTDILRAKEVDVGGLPAIIVCNKVSPSQRLSQEPGHPRNPVTVLVTTSVTHLIFGRKQEPLAVLSIVLLRLRPSDPPHPVLIGDSATYPMTEP